MGNIKVILALVLLALTIGTGYWLSLAGKPLNQIILTLHKLIAAGAVILAVLAVIQLHRTADIHTLALILLVFMGLMVVTLFATGAILSPGKTLPGIVLNLHRACTLLTLLCAVGVLWIVK